MEYIFVADLVHNYQYCFVYVASKMKKTLYNLFDLGQKEVKVNQMTSEKGENIFFRKVILLPSRKCIVIWGFIVIQRQYFGKNRVWQIC